MLHVIRYINVMVISSNHLGVQLHSTSSEPYFYDTAYALVDRCSTLPVDEYGHCISAEEEGCHDANTNQPTKWNVLRNVGFHQNLQHDNTIPN